MHGLDVRFDTFLSHLIGGPTAIGAAGENRLTSIMEFNSNVAVDLKVPEAEKFATDWRGSGHDTDFSALNFVTMIDMLTDAINKAGSTDPLKVALALEDMHEKDLLGPGNHHAQGRPSVADAVLRRRVQQGREIRRRAHRLRLEELHDGDSRRPDAADHLQDEAAGMTGAKGCEQRGARTAVMEIVLVSLFNGLVYGMLLFMLASGLTLIFSMMGVLNFAHASIYMIGAYLAFTVSQLIGFFPALIIAPILCGLIGAAIEVWGLRRVHSNGHIAELLFTFGLVFIIQRSVQMIWGMLPMAYRVPPSLDFPLFTFYGAQLPGLSRLHAAGLRRHAAGDLAAAEEDPRRPGDPGRADPSANGERARP